MSAIAVALIAGVVALVVAYLNGILTESYKRFRDGSALAAGLAGELASYLPAWPLLKTSLDSIVGAIESGQRWTVCLRPFERPRDLVFEESVSKLGLLDQRWLRMSFSYIATLGPFVWRLSWSRVVQQRCQTTNCAGGASPATMH